MSDKLMAILNMLLLMALMCRNWQIMERVSELEGRIDKLTEGADDADE